MAQYAAAVLLDQIAAMTTGDQSSLIHADSVMRATPNWHALHPHERESLEMIALKIGRILAGDPHFRDHWADIAGYAQLSAERNGGAL